jgi:DinB family protein
MNLTAMLTLFAGAAFAADTSTVAKIYDVQLSGIEKEMVPLAEAMPADKYDFAPTGGAFQGVRTFAQQAKHVAAVLYMVAAGAMEQKPPVELGSENGPDQIKTKDQVVQFLKDAFTYGHKAMLSMTSANEVQLVKSPFGDMKEPRGNVAASAIWHSFDHYGQMVVYARMNNVVPPASR